MLAVNSIKLKNQVSPTDENSPYYKKLGVIIFVEEKKGFRRTLSYYDITVKFPGDEKEYVFKEWMLLDPFDVTATEVEPEVEEKAEPELKKKKRKRQSAKRMGLTNLTKSNNLITVHSEHPTQPKDNTMSQNTAATDTTPVDATVVAAPAAKRGRKVSETSAIHSAIPLIRALPVAERTSVKGIAEIESKLNVKHGTAMVYFYNAINELRASGEHPVKAVKAPKVPKAKKVKADAAVDTAPVSVNAPADSASAEDTSTDA